MIDAARLMAFAMANPKLIKMVYHPTVPNLVKLNYRSRAMSSGWPQQVIESRGIIIDQDTGSVIARPFDKFFNLGEQMQLEELPSHLDYWIVEKMDGVLVIPFKYDDFMFVSTRGSFDNEFTDLILRDGLHHQLEELEFDTYTFMFELIHPEARIVTNYGDRKALVLIGIRETESGKMMDPGFVQQYAAANGLQTFGEYDTGEDAPIEDGILEDMKDWGSDNLEEGWVIQFENGLLIKVKRTEYIAMVRLIQKVSFKHIIDYMIAGTYSEYWKKLPEEVQEQANDIAVQIIDKQKDIELELRRIVDDWHHVKHLSRKTIAIRLQKDKPEFLGMVMSIIDLKGYYPSTMHYIKRHYRDMFGKEVEEE